MTSILTAWGPAGATKEGVAASNNFLHSRSSSLYSLVLPLDGDLHGVHCLIDLDVAPKVLLQGLDCLAPFANNAAHDAFGAL